MSRPLKPLQVERMFVQKHHVGVELFLDRNDKVFFATFEVERIEAPSLNELKEKVKLAVERSKPVTWTRVIELSCSPRPDFHHGGREAPMEHHSIEVEFRRVEVGATSDGRKLIRPFTEDLDEKFRRPRQEENPNEYATVDYHADDDTRMPYTEATWAAVRAVASAIDKAREKISELFDAKDGGKKLIAMSGIKLLGDGTKWSDAPKDMLRKKGRVA